jgi:hypothetical protein
VRKSVALKRVEGKRIWYAKFRVGGIGPVEIRSKDSRARLSLHEGD